MTRHPFGGVRAPSAFVRLALLGCGLGSLLLAGCGRGPGGASLLPPDRLPMGPRPLPLSGDTVVTLNGYGITVPAGMALTRTGGLTAKTTRTTYRWRGPIRADKTRTVLVWEILQARPGMETDPAPVILAQDSRDNAARHSAYVASRIEAYTINGFHFCRYYWKGLFPVTNSRNHGFVYVASDPHTIIYIRATDGEPYSKTTLPGPSSPTIRSWRAGRPWRPPSWPFPVSFVQTNNGFEFMKRFHARCLELGLEHHHIHKSSPNENAVIERSFRTDQEEFFQFRLHRWGRPETLLDLNEKYARYLHHYNTERPHYGLQFLTPAQKLEEYEEHHG